MKNYQNTALVLKGGGYKAYFANPTKFVMVTTNCLTGKAEYLEKKGSSR